VVNDPERDGFVDVILKPAAHLDQLEEVLVITATEPRFPPDQQQDIATSEALKGVEAAEQKTSEGMAEKLPGLIDPNVPPDQQLLNDTSNPNPVSRPPVALHPDRFTPASAATPAAAATTDAGQAAPARPPAAAKKKSTPPATDQSNPARAPQGDKQ
jgi:rod shape-determining protein MreC